MCYNADKEEDKCGSFNTFWPRQNGHHPADDCFKFISWMKMLVLRSKFHRNLIPKGSMNDKNPALVKIMIWCRIGDKPLPLMAVTRIHPSAAYMRQWIESTLVQIMACRLFGANHFLYPCWVIVNWTLMNKLKWNFKCGVGVWGGVGGGRRHLTMGGGGGWGVGVGGGWGVGVGGGWGVGGGGVGGGWVGVGGGVGGWVGGGVGGWVGWGGGGWGGGGGGGEVIWPCNVIKSRYETRPISKELVSHLIDDKLVPLRVAHQQLYF